MSPSGRVRVRFSVGDSNRISIAESTVNQVISRRFVEEAANAMATGNSAPAAPSAHPDAKWQATRDISTLVASDDTSLSPRFVVVSEYCVAGHHGGRVHRRGLTPQHAH